MRIHNDPSRFGRIPDPPEPESDEWFEEHCPRCKYNHEYEENGKIYAECTQGGCTGAAMNDWKELGLWVIVIVLVLLWVSVIISYG